MHPDIERLADLQAVDVRLTELRGRLAALPQQLAEVEKQVAEARQQVTAAKDALTTSLKERKTFEMDVESWKEKARKYRNQSAEVKSNEAYKALLHEIQHAEDEMGRAEDRLLQRMVDGEECERQVKGAEKVFAGMESAADTSRKKLRAEEAERQRELEVKEAERAQKMTLIPENLLLNYDRIAQRHHGVGLSEVRNEACTLCGVRIRPHVFQELRRADCRDIFHCETCTRILYYVEPPPADATSAG